MNNYSNEIKNFTNSLLSYFPIPPKNINTWYDITDKLIRIDGYTQDQIIKIIDYFRKDSFWSANFQSY